MHLTKWRIKGGKLPVLSRMIALDLLKTWLAVWSVLVVVIVSRSFIRVLDKAIEGRVSGDTLLSILGLKTLSIGTSLLPAALFMAVLMVLGRMYRDQEMSAVASAGGGCGTIYRAVFLWVLPVSLMAGGLSLHAAPWAEAQMTLLMQQDADSADLRGIASGKFSEYSRGDLVFYVEDISKDKTMRKVFVQSRLNGEMATINSQTAHLEEMPDGRYIVFADGERVQGSPGQLDYQIERFAKYAVRVEDTVSAVVLNLIAMPWADLLQASGLPEIAELQRRLSVPFAAFLFAFLAVPLAQTAPRGGIYGNVLIGFLIYFSYGNLAKVSQLWVSQGVISPWLGGLAINLFLFLVGMVLLARLQGWRWLLAVLTARLPR